MAHHDTPPTNRGEPDAVLKDIAQYVTTYNVMQSKEAMSTARYALLDAIGCGLQALQFPECTKLLGPVVAGTVVPNGARVPGTNYVLDPITAAFDIGVMNRWLDFNDTWLAAEWGHPSDNAGAVLAVADYLSRKAQTNGSGRVLRMREVLEALIKCYEIQGCLALENSFNKVGLDHVALVKVASTAVATHMLGGGVQDIVSALSNAFIDGQSLRTYRHFPNTGSRKSWAAGDATSRAVRLALMTMQGEMGYPTALTAKQWGFYDVLFRSTPFKFQRPYGTYVMENILFKVSFPAEFHAQTAVECALQLHQLVQSKGGPERIRTVRIDTHLSAVRIIDKRGPLTNPADRDHCLQYMTAVALVEGELRAEHYEEHYAAERGKALIDPLREKMTVREEPRYSADYHDPEKRSIANAVQIEFADSSSSDRVECEYPLGHRRRRHEAIPAIERKFTQSLQTRYTHRQQAAILAAVLQQESFEALTVPEFMSLFVVN